MNDIPAANFGQARHCKQRLAIRAHSASTGQPSPWAFASAFSRARRCALQALRPLMGRDGSMPIPVAPHNAPRRAWIEYGKAYRVKREWPSPQHREVSEQSFIHNEKAPGANRGLPASVSKLCGLPPSLFRQLSERLRQIRVVDGCAFIARRRPQVFLTRYLVSLAKVHPDHRAHFIVSKSRQAPWPASTSNQ